ncbi:NB-ARC domain-containing protein [Mastigocoleus sp. MO_188.B34]|uniref:NB-ARC domain-containing protein n=1 Tax=Mastigocoleus sp. MO_188.B34 TaxID=3036635 RepID=UPI002614DE9D|nr:NB-ARC domain-containing protein [Mastigocoleus sp. MO_188.B34]MDJ0697809.1 NB-ARC domain-containing protein [Mastigocoleus sp. MO_188.B34]
MNIEDALITLNTLISKDCLNDLTVQVFRYSWEDCTYEEIATKTGYEVEYVRQVGSKLWKLLSQVLQEKVTKSNFRSVIQLYSTKNQTLSRITKDTLARPTQTSHIINSLVPGKMPHQDWGDVIDVSTFFGRVEETQTLKRWILEEGCHLVTILGMGGIGKTSLAASVVHQIQGEFDCLIWRSLRHAPPLDKLLEELCLFLGKEDKKEVSGTIDSQILYLINCLRCSRCLLILDNCESILEDVNDTGNEINESFGYIQLIQYLAQTAHNSTVVLTSREKPPSLVLNEGEKLAVRSLQLKGLALAEAQAIFQTLGNFSGTISEWEILIEHYAGNPLLLKIAATGIQDFFAGNISEFIKFLEQTNFVFDDIRNLLEQQFNRLSHAEKEVMYTLAIHQQPISFAQLCKDMMSEEETARLLETIQVLSRRSLIENSLSKFTQKPVIVKFVREKLSEKTGKSIIC